GEGENGGCIGKKGGRHNQEDQGQKKTFAAAVGCPQKYITDVIEQTRRHQRSCHHHTAKQESQRSAECSNDVQNILQTEHPNRGEGADSKQRGQRHVEKIEDDQQEDTAKDNEGNDGL